MRHITTIHHIAKGLVGLSLTLIIAAAVWAETIDIHPGQSIQTALRTATKETTLRLLPGIHTENIRIDRSVRLVGDPESPDSVILKSRMAGAVVTVTGNDEDQLVVLEGFTIREATGFLPDGILHLGTSVVNCRNLMIEACQRNGISVGNAGSMTIEDCLIRGNGRYGIDVQSSEAHVAGARNHLRENGADLGGYANPELRVPTVAEIPDLWIAHVPEDYATLQEAVDAVASGGRVVLGEGEFVGGATIWKSVSISGIYPTKTALLPAVPGGVLFSVLASALHVALDRMTLHASEMNPISIYGEAGFSLEKVRVLGEGTINQDPVFRVQHGSFQALDCVFANIGGIAIEAQSGSSLYLERCEFRDNYRDLVMNGVALASINADFFDTRELAVLITDSLCHMEGCRFESGLFGFSAVESQVSLMDCHFSQITNTGITFLSGVHAVLEACTITACTANNIAVYDDATVEIIGSTIASATHTGLVASDSSIVIIDECLFESNGVAGLILSQSATAELTNSIVRSNGWSPPNDSVAPTPQSAGIAVCMGASCTLTSVDILGNAAAGIFLSPDNPFSDVLEAGVFHDVFAAIPQLVATDCSVSGNSEDGVLVTAAGTLVLDNCSFTSNGETGIYLLGLACGWSGSTIANLDYHCEVSDDIHVIIEDCSLRSNIISGLILEGGAAATVRNSSLAENGIGLVMDLDAVLDLTHCDVMENRRYGVMFYSEQCQAGQCTSSPKADRLTGYGNTIPGPDDPKGNGIGAFTSSPVEYLLVPGESKGK